MLRQLTQVRRHTKLFIPLMMRVEGNCDSELRGSSRLHGIAIRLENPGVVCSHMPSVWTALLLTLLSLQQRADVHTAQTSTVVKPCVTNNMFSLRLCIRTTFCIARNVNC